MKKLLIRTGVATLIVFSALSAYAQSEARRARDILRHGLQSVPDRILLREVRQRGYSCSSYHDDYPYPGDPYNPLPALVVNVSCDPYTNMMVELYSPDGMRVSSLKDFTGSQNNCAKESSRILQELQGQRISRDKVIAYCDPYTNLKKLRITVSPASVKEVEKIFQGHSQRCDQAADQFNRMFN